MTGEAWFPFAFIAAAVAVGGVSHVIGGWLGRRRQRHHGRGPS